PVTLRQLPQQRRERHHMIVHCLLHVIFRYLPDIIVVESWDAGEIDHGAMWRNVRECDECGEMWWSERMCRRGFQSKAAHPVSTSPIGELANYLIGELSNWLSRSAPHPRPADSARPSSRSSR